MPHAPHVERHFMSSNLIRDLVIGLADGLTVPFALAAGLSGTRVSAPIIVTAGLAEIAAGSIAMGLGGYLAARGDAEHYASERAREGREVKEQPEEEEAEIRAIFESYGVTAGDSAPIVEALKRRPKAWIDFMMRFELGLEKPDPARARNSALTIAGAYVAGGLLPLAPYMLFSDVQTAFLLSIVTTGVALLAFGYAKGRFTGSTPFKNALQTVVVGGVAAAAAFLMAKIIS